jgi:hypothetical protein
VALSQTEPLSLRTGGGVAFEVTLTGRLRGTEERLKTIVQISLKLDPAGRVEVAEATVEPPVLDKIRQARLQP